MTTKKKKKKNGMVVINEIHSFVVNKKKSYIDFKQTQPCLIIIIIDNAWMISGLNCLRRNQRLVVNPEKEE